MKNTSSLLKALSLSLALVPAAARLNAVAAQAVVKESKGVQLAGRPDAPAEHRPGHARKAFGHGMAATPELRAYVRQNVMPVVVQQRLKLDAQLSAADKSQLDTYRAQLKALRDQAKAFHESLRPAAGTQPGQRPELTDAQRQQKQKLHEERRAVMQNVGQLAQKYDAQIKQLADEVQPQRDKWATDIKAIVVKNLTPEQQQRMQQRQEQGGGKHRGHDRMGGMLKQFAPARFLLMDPKAPNQPGGEPASGNTRAAMYPNPANATQRLEYTVAKEGSVKVELLDERGKPLRTLVDEKQEKGSRTLDVSLADLPRGTYFYKITTKGNTETRRFVKE